MKKLLFLLQKEFIQIRRNKIMLPIIFVVPIVQLVVLVYAATFDVKNINIGVIDKDQTHTSMKLNAHINSSPFFTLKEYYLDEELAEERMEKDQIDFVLIYSSGFEKDLYGNGNADIQVLANSINGQKAELGVAYLNAVVLSFNKNLIIDKMGISKDLADQGIVINERYWYNPELNYKFFMAPGILAILVTLIGMFLSGMNMVREKELGTIEQLNVSPVRKYQFILSKLIPFWFIALFDLAFGLAIAIVLFKLPFVGSVFTLLLFASVYLVGVLGLGLLISTITETQQQVMFVAFFFMLVFIMMGGIFTPVESMPRWAQMVDRINPMYYFMRVMRMITLKGSGFKDMQTEFYSLCVIGVTMISLAVWRFRKVS